jgi:hypothetical protein
MKSATGWILAAYSSGNLAVKRESPVPVTVNFLLLIVILDFYTEFPHTKKPLPV